MMARATPSLSMRPMLPEDVPLLAQIFRASIELGKFHGVIVATTPTGCLMTMIRLSSWWPGITSP